MQVILHTGVHCTDDDRLLKCLLRNADDWRHEGIAVPGPSRYRALLTEAVNTMVDVTPAPDAREIMLDAILTQDADSVDRLILSHENLFSVPKLLLGGGRYYRKAETRLRIICNLFRGDRVELFMALRDPASFLPAVYAATPHEDFSAFLNGVDPLHLRWSDLLWRIRTEVPEVPITVWCNEDTPLVWGEVVREIAGIELTRRIHGGFDVFASIISPEGMQRFRGFLRDHPTMNEIQRRRVMAAFLDKYAIEEAIEEELDLPGWDAAYVAALTRAYEEDMDRIAGMHGVTVITP